MISLWHSRWSYHLPGVNKVEMGIFNLKIVSWTRTSNWIKVSFGSLPRRSLGSGNRSPRLFVNWLRSFSPSPSLDCAAHLNCRPDDWHHGRRQAAAAKKPGREEEQRRRRRRNKSQSTFRIKLHFYAHVVQFFVLSFPLSLSPFLLLPSLLRNVIKRSSNLREFRVLLCFPFFFALSS